MPIEIPANLTNKQVKELLNQDLTLSELKTIASQRSVAIRKPTIEGIRQAILKNIERQEGYERLASPIKNSQPDSK